MYTSINQFKIKLDEEKRELYITNYYGNAKEINIAPEYEINEKIYKTTKIENKFNFGTFCETIKIPHTITLIGKNVFLNTSSLKKIIVDENNPKYCSIDGILYNKKQDLLIYCPDGYEKKSFAVPDKVRTIKENAFRNNKNIKEIFMNDNVEKIEAFAFDNCWSLEKIKLSNNINTFNRRVFADCHKLEEINIPQKISKIAAYAFFANEKLKSFILNPSVSLLGFGTFKSSGIKDFTIDNNCKIDYINPDTLCFVHLNNFFINKDISFIPKSITNSTIENLYFSSDVTSKTINLNHLKSVFDTTEVSNIYINKLNTEIKNLDKILEYCKEVGINLVYVEPLEQLETRYTYQQINQIIKGYQKGLLLNGLSPNISHETFRDLINIWDTDKCKALNLINQLMKQKTLEEMLNINKEISDLVNKKDAKQEERGDR